MKKFVAVIASLLVITMMLSACTPTVETPNGSNGGEVRKDLNIALGGEPLGLDPSTAYHSNDSLVVENMFDTLVNKTPEGEIVPSLAEDWEVTEDLLTYTFYLKEGVLFHNGEELKASDVKFSLENAKVQGHATETTDYFEDISVLDEYTVQVTMNAPNVSLINNFATAYFGIVNEEVYTAAGSDFAMNPVGGGTGAYQFVSWEPGISITLKKFDDYHGTPAVIETVNFKFIPESGSGTIALETGDVDIYAAPDFLDAIHMQNNSDLQVLIKEGIHVYYVLMNMDKAPFDDLNVRKAITYAINRADIVEAVVSGVGATVTNSLCMPWSSCYNDEIAPFDQDLEKAREYIAQSAYPDGFEAVMTVSTATEADATVLKDQLSKIGIDITIETLDFAAMAENYMSGEMEMGIMNSSTPTSDAAVELYDKIVSTSWINFSHYSNPEFDELIFESLGTYDEDVRCDMLYRAQQMLMDDMPVVPMYRTNNVMAANASLKNFDFGIGGSSIDLKSLTR